MSDKKKYSYKSSGVDIHAGEQLVNSIKDLAKSTHNPSVIQNIGGFGALYLPDLSGYRQPVLVSSVDGVGTKLKVAFRAGIYDTVGQDLVNHCVNDIAVCGAEPLYFLDYFSTGKLENHIALDVIKGFSKACGENGCALIGGETAEMPDIYTDGEFDLAGMIVGIVDRDRIFDGSRVQRGDVLLGIPSTGLHTNGYSLARKVLFNHYEVNDHVDELDCTIGEALLSVHRSYLNTIRYMSAISGVHAFSHITGGGIKGNTKRVIPEGFELNVDWKAWDRPAIFKLIQKLGDVDEEDMQATFNLGIGLVVIVDVANIHKVRSMLKEQGEESVIIGTVE